MSSVIVEYFRYNYSKPLDNAMLLTTFGIALIRC